MVAGPLAGDSRCAEVLHVISEPTRFRLVQALIKGDACVSELAEALRLRPATVSHHLSILKAADVVEALREGKRVRYQLTALFHSCVPSQRRPSGPSGVPDAGGVRPERRERLELGCCALHLGAHH